MMPLNNASLAFEQRYASHLKHLILQGLQTMTVDACTLGMKPSTQSSMQPPLSERPKLQCLCCGAAMVIVRRRIAPQASKGGAAGPPGAALKHARNT